jgi:hypothetical protein
MKTIDKDKDPISLVAEQMKQLRKELREKISDEPLQWESLDRIAAASQVDPVAFDEFWIQPLLAAGLSLECAIGCIIDSCLWPN